MREDRRELSLSKSFELGWEEADPKGVDVGGTSLCEVGGHEI